MSEHTKFDGRKDKLEKSMGHGDSKSGTVARICFSGLPEDACISGNSEQVNTALKYLNAFAALAEHLGRDPAELEVDLVQIYQTLIYAKRAVENAIEVMNTPSSDPAHAALTEIRQALAALEK